jgi:hypothetical protein
MSKLTSISAPQPLFRLAHRPDPWGWPPWEYCRRANRWDDPTRFRPDPAVVAGLAEIDGDDEGALRPGQVPVSWVAARAMGTANFEGLFADVGAGESLAYLRTAMASRLVHYGLADLDGSVIRESRREFTQEISLHIFGQADLMGAPIFTGIAYASRLGNEFINWAIFERADRDPVRDPAVSEIALDDPDLVATLVLFALKLV